MYNKLFTKILDSSIWLEPTPTRIIWLTLIASMDEDGFCAFAALANLAHRARVKVRDAEQAVATLEEPDPHSSDTEHEGRRLERVPGGWIVLNAKKYGAIVTRAEGQRLHRERSQRYRERQRDAGVTPRDVCVTQSDTDTDTDTDQTQKERSKKKKETARCTRLPADFALTDERRHYAVGKGCRNPERTFEAFTTFYRGSGKTQLDWDATFRTWVLGAHGGPDWKACGCQPRTLPGQLPPGAAQAALDEKRRKSDERVRIDQARREQIRAEQAAKRAAMGAP